MLNLTEEKRKLSELFNSLDLNHDGKVSLNELETAILSQNNSSLDVE